MSTAVGQSIPIFLETMSFPTKVSVDTSAVVDRLQAGLIKRLAKRGRGIVWTQAPEQAAIWLQVKIDPGSQLLRWLVPFSAPAVVSVFGEFRGGAQRAGINVQGTAHFGLFGGTPAGMLRVSADRASASLAKLILRSV